MKFGTQIGLAVGAAAMSLTAWSGAAGAAPIAAASQRSVAGSYLLDFTVSNGGGGGYDQPLTLESNGTAEFQTCPGLWTLSGKKLTLEATCSGAEWLFDGSVSPKGLGTEKKPGTFIATFQSDQGPQTDTGTWYATEG
jgi:hypothetical protein